ncbi:MAG TPA: hypothetical protein VN026_15950 [Bacteroidia bacterium]|jgi:hypothetical protein|nr:hypothetical protein [Bacteroidia bacterium]
MLFTIPSNSLPFSLVIDIETDSPQSIKMVARDYSKQNTNYIIRRGVVDGKRTFTLKFPLSPNVMSLFIFNERYGNQPNDTDKSFRITKFSVESLKTCPMWTNADVTNFIEFGEWFCQNAGELSGTTKTLPFSTYRSKNGKFCIDFYNKIPDKQNGGYVSTPARVGHSSGIIEIAKEDFDKYSVPMRFCILSHEFSHKYLNPISKREIGDEISADIWALNIYMSLGFPSLEAQYAFLRVFSSANNLFNSKRYKIINAFISDFNSGKLNNCNTDYTPQKAA